jgi:hypothetical protein
MWMHLTKTLLHPRFWQGLISKQHGDRLSRLCISIRFCLREGYYSTWPHARTLPSEGGLERRATLAFSQKRLLSPLVLEDQAYLEYPLSLHVYYNNFHMQRGEVVSEWIRKTWINGEVYGSKVRNILWFDTVFWDGDWVLQSSLTLYNI